MKKLDMHVHCRTLKPDAEHLLANMEQGGVWGCVVISNPPLQYDPVNGVEFEERLRLVHEWTKNHPDRLFPVLWIHPYEENIFEKIKKAVDSGICAFKIICTDFYVYEERSIEVLKEIAKYNKAVIFHSGILWDGKVSSAFNRPINFESLLSIKGLRFSMGHCSWPWIDECIAMYGKFLNALTKGETAEMFFDITPGTPEIYREELLTKLFTIGYDVENNVMFGTDARTDNYSSNWAKEWLKTDGKILDKLGVSKNIREKMYYKNLLRFLGIDATEVTHRSPVPDDSNRWVCYNPEVLDIIKKWYQELEFSPLYQNEFDTALRQTKISDAIEAETYDMAETDGKRNLLSYLYMCDSLWKKYQEKGISYEIFKDTIHDIVVWTDTWSNLKGELYLGEINWLKRHMTMKLFKLGRLQFCMAELPHDLEGTEFRQGDKVIEVHIPEGGGLTPEACDASFAMAKEFFTKFYPEFDYCCFTCHSWLLDDTLCKFIKPESNMIQFQNRFQVVSKEKSDAILRYTFAWNTTRSSLKNRVATSSFAQKVKEHALSGGEFYEAEGYILK